MKHPVTTMRGSELPLLAWHHATQGDAAVSAQPGSFKAPETRAAMSNKPRGGLWTSPAMEPPKAYADMPWSAWAEWCYYEGMTEFATGYRTEVIPDPDATFAVIDTAMDAALLLAAYPLPNPLPDYPVSRYSTFDKLIDWGRLADEDLAGFYLTEAGQHATRFPDKPVPLALGNSGMAYRDYDVPSLYGWDCATVWFREPRFTTGATVAFVLPEHRWEDE